MCSRADTRPTCLMRCVAKALLGAGVAVLLATTHAAAQDARRDPEATSSMKSSDLVRLVCNEQTPMETRAAALAALLDRAPDERTQALSEVITKADEDFAATAARAALYGRICDVSQAVVKRPSGWSPRNQVTLVEPLFNDPKILRDLPSVLEIPRQIVGDVLAGGRPGQVPQEDQFLGTATDQAALILGTASQNPADQKLLQAALAKEAHSRGLWLARAWIGGLTDAEASLAKKVYSDASLPVPVRVAAAVAAAPKDPDADALVRSSVADLLAKFGDTESAEALLSQMSSDNPQVVGQRFLDLMNRLSVVGSLRFLKTQSASDLTFSALKVANKDIRRIAAMVAAVRWPERLIQEAPKDLLAEPNSDCAALIVSRRPDLKGEVTKRVPSSELAAASKRLHERGDLVASGYVGVIGDR